MCLKIHWNWITSLIFPSKSLTHYFQSSRFSPAVSHGCKSSISSYKSCDQWGLSLRAEDSCTAKSLSSDNGKTAVCSSCQACAVHILPAGLLLSQRLLMCFFPYFIDGILWILMFAFMATALNPLPLCSFIVCYTRLLSEIFLPVFSKSMQHFLESSVQLSLNCFFTSLPFGFGNPDHFIAKFSRSSSYNMHVFSSLS